MNTPAGIQPPPQAAPDGRSEETSTPSILLEAGSELLLLPDGRIMAHNLTPSLKQILMVVHSGAIESPEPITKPDSQTHFSKHPAPTSISEFQQP